MASDGLSSRMVWMVGSLLEIQNLGRVHKTSEYDRRCAFFLSEGGGGDGEEAAVEEDPASLIEGSPIDFSDEDFERLKLPLLTTVTDTSLTLTNPLLIPPRLRLALPSLFLLVSSELWGLPCLLLFEPEGRRGYAAADDDDWDSS